MKYFTPDLLARFGAQDEAIALTAQEELEAHAEQYTQHLNDVAAKLPLPFREMQERFYLHDARLLSPWFPTPDAFSSERYWLERIEMPALQQEGDCWSSLFLALQLDSPPKEVLVLNYRSVLIEEISHHRPFQETHLPFLEWLHDEVDVATENGVAYTFHSILFSNGFELRLRFREFDFATMKPLPTPAGTNGQGHRR